MQTYEEKLEEQNEQLRGQLEEMGNALTVAEERFEKVCKKCDDLTSDLRAAEEHSRFVDAVSHAQGEMIVKLDEENRELKKMVDNNE